jgi:protein-S-isoprenylcysteine O-methyltransferase Ste14
MARVRLGGLASAAGNLSLAILFGLFAVVHMKAFLAFGRASALLVVGKEALDAFFYLTRPSARSFSRSPYAWIAGFGGTFLPVLLRPTVEPVDALVGQVVIYAGLALQAAGMLSLRRSIGIVPANRGIKTGGLYRFVRHPLYLSYAISQVGYWICNPSAHNGAVITATILCHVLRIFNEERFLRRDPEYAAFALRTRWALLPGVF